MPENNIKSEYELVVLFQPALEANLKPALDKVAKVIKDNGGEIVAEDDWGRKELAYKIAGETHAIYRVYTLQLPAEAPGKISDVFNITGEVIRYLLTKVDPRVKEALAEEKARAEKRAAERDDSRAETDEDANE
ncbi:30S ribosomal protein S6 [Candidatus Saccharibacteria bacterium]|nr:30S ribosomal protein S6 [Candidatus Saccharibacteria bacterium]